MKKYINLILIIMSVFLLTGCQEQYTEEERYQMCIDRYVERTKPEMDFEVKDTYETVEDTYHEIIRLALWHKEQEDQIYELFDDEVLWRDDELRASIQSNGLSSYTAEDYLEREETTFRTNLDKVANQYLKAILNVSPEEIKNSRDAIYQELEENGMFFIAEAEKYKQISDYQEMFLSSRKSDFVGNMYYTLYPEEYYQGALDCIYEKTHVRYIDEAKEFFIEIGEYEKYAEDIDYYRYWINEAVRCDYGTCQDDGTSTAKGYSGEYCWWHAALLEDGGLYREKERPPFEKSSDNTSSEKESSGSLGGPDLGYTDEEEDDTPSEKKPSKKEEKEEKKEEKKEIPYDPYDVYDYSDPEDFYYDWEEDFDGFEDVEEYWEDAWDEIE